MTLPIAQVCLRGGRVWSSNLWYKKLLYREHNLGQLLMPASTLSATPFPTVMPGITLPCHLGELLKVICDPLSRYM